jgi:hypothetical protein
MPSANRFVSLRDTVRNHPVMVASSAASAGVLLGGFVAFQLLTPMHPRTDSAATAPAPIAAKAEAKSVPEKPAPETTGFAPASDRTASVDCENETWPHLSPPCVEEMRNKHRTRVISTDKLDQSTITAIEGSRPVVPESKSAAQPAAPAVAATAAVSPPSSPPVDLNAAPSAVFAAPEPSASALTSAAPSRSQSAAEPEPKKEKRVAKSKRKPKAEPKTTPAKQETDDDDDTPSTTASVASSDPDDRASDDRVSDDRSHRRVDRRDRRRTAERWNRREYDVPADDGDGQRRVIVIRRGGGLFEGLFGD